MENFTKEQQDSIAEFNKHPTIGISNLLNAFNVSDNPFAIAKFLQKNHFLSEKSLGEYFTKFPQYLHPYFNELKLNADFILALRACLSSNMVLPAESEDIDIILRSISEVYCLQHPDVYDNSDQVHILAFAVLLLNTDLHHPGVKSRMKKSQFIQNTQITSSIFSPSDLGKIYDDVKNHPLTFGTIKEGVFEKKSDRWNSHYVKHFFSLQRNELFYFENESIDKRNNPLGCIQFRSVKIKLSGRIITVMNHHRIPYEKYSLEGNIIFQSTKKLFFCFSDDIEAKTWFKYFHDCVVKKKKVKLQLEMRC